MFTLIRKDTGEKISFEPTGTLSLFLNPKYPDTFSLNILIASKNLIALDSEYAASISLSSETLMFQRGSFENDDIRNMSACTIVEKPTIDSISSFVFSVKESEKIFSYYIDDYLDASLSDTVIEYTGNDEFIFQHRATIDEYSVDIDILLEYTGLRCVLWKNEGDIVLQEKELLILLEKYRLAYNIDAIKIEDHPGTRAYTIPPRAR